MLKQHNFQMTKPKKRKLYTPLSDEEENLESEIEPKNDSEKVELNKIENCALKPTEETQQNKIAITDITLKELDEDEIAENLSWESIKPNFRKNPVFLQSIWEHSPRFNPIEVANKFKMYRKLDKNEVNLNQIMDVLMTANTIGKNSKKQQINASFINNKKEQEISGHSSKNQFNSVAKVQQPVNSFSIKAISPAINCGTLSSIFTQHEISKENQNIEQIKSSIKDDFIGSQFINTSIINVEDEITTDSVNRTKPLIDPNQILNEWLRDSPSSRLQLADSDEDIPKTSLLSESKKKIHNNEALSKCFL